MSSSLVSVLMTSFNREKFIAEAIESVINSSFQNWELIIVDDWSQDSTVSISKNYAMKDSRIRVYVNEVNLGDYPNRNMAASYAVGKYLMFCDSDDTILPHGIEYCYNAMEKFPQAEFGLFWAYKISDPFLRRPIDSINSNFFGEPFLGMGPGSTIINKLFFDQIGKYPVKYGPANDMYFNIKVATLTNIVLLPKKFSHYRIHEHQERNNLISYLLNNYLYLKDVFSEINIPLSNLKREWVLKQIKEDF